MSFPKKVAIFTATFEDVGTVDEALRVAWNYPDYPNNPGNRRFLVGSDCFLETPTSITQVPDDQLLASLSMMGILAGGILPGTKEYLDAMTTQDTTNFQTIIGNAKVKTITSVVDAQVGPLGTVFDVEFQKVGASTPTKTVRCDAWSLSQYGNRVDNAAVSVPVVPGAIHKIIGFKKSQLGAADSANRQAVIDFIAAQLFWI